MENLLAIELIVLAIGGIFASGGLWVQNKSLGEKVRRLEEKYERERSERHNFCQQNLGSLKADIRGMLTDIKNDIAKDIERLEKKQDKYNNMQERVATAEQSAKAAHLRLDRYGKKVDEHIIMDKQNG